MKTALLVNSGFALRQVNGLPVYTEERMFNRLNSKEQIKNTIHKMVKCKKGKLIFIKNEKGKKAPERIRGKINHPLDVSRLQRIIITPKGKGYISTAFLDFAKNHAIPIYWINNKSMVEAAFFPSYFRRASLIIKQCEARSNGKNIDIAKYLIRLKLESEGMDNLIPKLNKANSIKDILQVEGNASRDYFNQWDIPDKWRFNGRHGKTSINANAIDPINACLNLGYALLAQQMSEILIKRGYELSIGFMHHSETSKTYWNMLAYDFIEPYRTWIDRTVKEMIAKNEIKPTDFTFSEDKSKMVFKDYSFKVALGKFMKTLEPLKHKSLPLIRKIEKML